MYGQNPRVRQPFGMGGGPSAPPPRDVILLLVTLFATYSLRFFAATAAIPAWLELTPFVWARGFVWQVATYPLIGYPSGGLWFLFELLILFWFARDVRRYLGKKGFLRLLGWSCIPAGIAAVLVQLLMTSVGSVSPAAFDLMQGQRMLMAVVIAAFACAYRNATIYLFFVLPVQARWFVALEILFAFMGFLVSKDLAGFVGICVGVGMAWAMLSGGLMANVRRLRLQAQHLWYRGRLAAARRKRGIRVVPGGKKGGGRGSGGSGDGPTRGPWVH